jgi:hypothetical protein
MWQRLPVIGTLFYWPLENTRDIPANHINFDPQRVLQKKSKCLITAAPLGWSTLQTSGDETWSKPLSGHGNNSVFFTFPVLAPHVNIKGCYERSVLMSHSKIQSHL